MAGRLAREDAPFDDDGDDRHATSAQRFRNALLVADGPAAEPVAATSVGASSAVVRHRQIRAQLKSKKKNDRRLATMFHA
eukprot:SAG31_NODE_5604_length_2426_cov_3.721960_1_plen_80_part_00